VSAADPAAGRELRDAALELADLADGLTLPAFRGHLDVRTKADGTWVTQVDVAVERSLREAIAARFPDHAVLGEEDGRLGPPDAPTWVIDPIDGTTNFVYGHHQVAISIAVEFGGEAIVGVVDAPLLGERFTAIRGEGAWLTTTSGGATTSDPRRLRCSDETDIARALVGTGFGYAAARRSMQAQVLTSVLPRVRDIRRLGSAALDLCWVATGRLDAYYEIGLNRWDYAAGALVAAEAGAVVRPLAPGDALDVGVLVACPPALETALVALLQEAGAG
jgi:myo-inositol-1(or 4)-monophosphatase